MMMKLLKIRILLNHGQTQRYKHEFIGINGRLDTLQAAILNVKLKYLEKELDKRQKLAQIYNANLKTVKFHKLIQMLLALMHNTVF